jgi:uncharacterized membrane protein SpoIIM required for sporulation
LTEPAENQNIDSSTISWTEIEILLNRLESNKSENPSDDILRLGELYTELISDLNKLNDQPWKEKERNRANKLALRAYSTIYQPRSMSLKDFIEFFLFGFPRLVRDRMHFIFSAMMIFIFSTMVGFLCISEKSKLIDLVIEPSQQEYYQSTIKNIDPNQPRAGRFGNSFRVSSFIMTNNIKVSFKAFATGFFFGIGTIYVLIINGLLLGGLASLYTTGGLAAYFWSLILPHGGIELICIFISGGAGLMIGHALINPGRFTRKDRLILEGSKAVKLVFGTIPMLVFAALIEAYITPANISQEAKFIFSVLFLGSTLAWLFLGNIFSWKDLRNLIFKKD